MATIFWRLLPFRVPRLFGRRQDTDYEVILAKLNSDIDKIQTRLTQIRARQRRAAITFTAYALGAWALYTLACYALGELTWEPLPLDDTDAVADSLWSARTLFVWFPILLSPLLILSTRRIFGWWYKRIENAEEAHLQDLRKRQREKIAEIKRATDFDHLRMLLDKYDEDRPRGAGPGAAGVGAQQQRGQGPRQSMPVGSTSAAAAAQQQQQQQQQSRGPNGAGRGAPRHSMPAQLQGQQQQQGGQGATGLGAPFNPGQGGAASQGPDGASIAQAVAAMGTAAARGPSSQQQQQQQQPAQQQPPVQRTVMDKFADWMFGPDPSLGGGTGVSAAMQKYALICTRCYAHNGLAMPHEFDEIQYVCPRCGAFNSRRPSSVPVSTPAFFNRGSISNPSSPPSSSPGPQQSRAAPASAAALPAGSASSKAAVPPALAEETSVDADADDAEPAAADAKAGNEGGNEDEGSETAKRKAGLRQRAGRQDAMEVD
ncbi:hypothetical protein OC844_003218 [Tilletia horrida]|nr:hypothetical protein OC844_003218 [Tilletia horrida]